MPRSRGSEVPQRQSPRQLRTSSSDSVTDRSPKLGPRSDPLNQRKLGARIADLESQLGTALEELKTLKDQLASAEAAKKAAQEQLDKKSAVAAQSDPIHETNNEDETDVFEVQVSPPNVDSSTECATRLSSAEPEKPPLEELSLKDDELSWLKSKLEATEKQLDVFYQENESLKKELNEMISSTKAKEEETSVKLSQVTQELETSKNDVVNVKEKLKATEKAKEALENEMKKLRVQTEQWRKAADAAAAVLAGGVEMNGRRLSERCGSMDNKHVFVGGYGSYMGSPGLVDDSDDVYGHGKRKASGIKMFGDLWKKKGQK